MNRLLWLLVLISCSSEPKPTRLAGIRMTIPYQVLIGDTLSAQQQSAVEAVIESVFQEVDDHYNNWNPQSELSRINRGAANRPISLSDQLAGLLAKADEMVQLTDRVYDPTIATVQSIWRSHFPANKRPSSDLLDAASAHTGWHHLCFHENSVIKDHSDVTLDLCGIAKGYAVDLIVERLTALGLSAVYVVWGGEIRATGRHPAGRPWSAAIRSPHAPSALATIEIQNQAVATSGDYQQFWTLDDRTYTHVYHPASQEPLLIGPNQVASATVIAPSCWLADGLATAALLAPSREEAEALCQRWEEELPGVRLFLVYRSS